MNTDVLKILQQRFPVSSCPAAEIEETKVIPAPPDQSEEQVVQRVEGGSEVAVGNGRELPLSALLADLDAEIREQILRLVEIEGSYPIRAYMSEDLLRGGVYKPAAFWEREDAAEIASEHSRLFFGAGHADICRIFREHLVAEGRKYLKFKRDMILTEEAV